MKDIERMYIDPQQQLDVVRQHPILYHGTSYRALASILAQGIAPRKTHRRTNWEAAVESNEDTVYLTTAYAHYFAVNATNSDDATDAGVVLEVATDQLDFGAGFFVPDEDCIEQGTRGHHIPGTPRWLSGSRDMVRRTRWFRRHAHKFDPNASLENLGTVGWRGVVPVAAVRRLVLIPRKTLIDLLLAYDPTITILNYRLLGERYRTFMRSLFDAAPSASDALVPLPHTVHDVLDDVDGKPRALTCAEARAQLATSCIA